MKLQGSNKRKIINDPVYGFISIPDDLLFELIEHPWYQRLRRIKQLGLTHLVYPGALHTRFNHSLGAMHLMTEALAVLKSKGINISSEESAGACIAILLHDIGHGPFSHALENSIINSIHHEELSGLFMDKLNEAYEGELAVGIDIFRHTYHKKFLSQLVSSQLDCDRLDYLTRDSFFTGVSEGVIGTQRIIKMLNVASGTLVAEHKGIYSIEKFLTARRIMYWQVYLHKTVLAAENMLIKILERAKYLVKSGQMVFASPALEYFLKNDFLKTKVSENEKLLSNFAKLDDFDIFNSVKVWCDNEDPILSYLCKSLANRHLFKCEIQREPFDYFYIEQLREKIATKFHVKEEDIKYFLISDATSNYAYQSGSDTIKILHKSGKVTELSDTSDLGGAFLVTKLVTKHFICYPKNVNN